MEAVMEVVGYCFDAVILYIFNRAFFGCTKPFMSLFRLVGVYVLTESFAMLINQIRGDIWINVLASVTSLAIVIYFYEGRPMYKAAGIILFQLLAIVAEMLTGDVLFIMMPDKAVSIYIPRLFVSKIILFLLVIIVQFFQKEKGDIPTKYLLCFMLIPLMSIFILCGVVNNFGKGRWSMYFLVICVFLVNLISYYLLTLLAGYMIKESKASQMQEQIRVQKEKYSQLASAFSKGNQLLHDVNKHLRYIYQDLEAGDTTKAMSYIEKIDASLRHTYNTIRTGNLVVDSILSNMQTRLADAGCACQIRIQIDACEIRMEDYDLVIVLGNIIDNQIEAVLQVVEEERRKAVIELKTARGSFLIHAKNGMNEEKKQWKKAEQWFHGFGLQNVAEVVERYGGNIITEEKDGWFEAMIVIPMEDKNDEY